MQPVYLARLHTSRTLIIFPITKVLDLQKEKGEKRKKELLLY